MPLHSVIQAPTPAHKHHSSFSHVVRPSNYYNSHPYQRCNMWILSHCLTALTGVKKTNLGGQFDSLLVVFQLELACSIVKIASNFEWFALLLLCIIKSTVILYKLESLLHTEAQWAEKTVLNLRKSIDHLTQKGSTNSHYLLILFGCASIFPNFEQCISFFLFLPSSFNFCGRVHIPGFLFLLQNQNANELLTMLKPTHKNCLSWHKNQHTMFILHNRWMKDLLKLPWWSPPSQFHK